jgi:hypothetical protein
LLQAHDRLRQAIKDATGSSYYLLDDKVITVNVRDLMIAANALERLIETEDDAE